MILYRAVGRGMGVFIRLRLRVEVQGDLELAPGTLYVATHRSDLDSPLLCGALYRFAQDAPASELPWFVVRDDLFLPGIAARLVPGRLPLSFGIGRLLERARCLRLRPATRMRAVELARAAPAAPLETLPHAAEFRARATELGRRPPFVLDDVLASAYADLLWRLVDRSESPQPEAAWAGRTAVARHDLERLLALMRTGASVLISPEGTPSRDGSVGPLQRGIGLVVRRGRPRRVVPIGLAYDPLGPGRTLGVVRVGEPVAPPTADIEEELRLLLRRTLPHTEGARLAYDFRHGLVTGPPPGPPDVLDRLSREYESAIAP